ncbi:ankyrin repeat-containing protein [Legionella busanensis]|uniref:Ankyrin repeat-containing protein n=1 Tax=Legionella busanensis TaxID=190655 RepID=A0A378JRH7_9GAMM|nr:ankyrin repeat domain-containing protein [Legionella busanensis]STX52833.1 ankyrin repeat-containing protein [Legionella busanensis]
MKVFIRSQVMKELSSDFETYEKALTTFSDNPSHPSLKLEKLQTEGDQPLYSIRDNRKRRIILCPIKTKLGEQVWIVTKILTRHEYKDLKKGGRAVGLSDAEKEAVRQAYFAMGSGKEEKSGILIKETTQIEYTNQQYIFLDDEQESLKKASLPRIINGAPGSGKTSTLLALIKHNMAHWVAQKEEGELPNILILAKSQYLVEQMKKEWKQMCQEDASIKPEWIDCIKFQTPEDIYRANHPEEAVTFLGEKEFTEWYLKYAKHYNSNLKKDQRPLPAGEVNASLVYQEMHTMSGYPSLEKYNKGVNDNLSLFPDPKAREAIWQVYQTYRTHIDNLNKLNKQQKVVDLSFNEIKLTEQYDFIGIDESQDLSRQQLRSLVQIDEKKSRKNLVLCVGDHQRLSGSESTVPFLKTLFWEGGEKKEITDNITTTLHASYRCAEPIVRFANAALYLKYQAIGGTAVTDNNELPFIKSIEQQKEKSVDVKWLGGHDPKSEEKDSEKLEIIAKNNQANADFVVITSPKYFDDAVKKFGRERVFTAKQMKGLQAKEILLYRFFEQDSFSAANKPMSQAKEIDLEQALREGKIPKGCETGNICHNNIFNELFVAITRAQTALTIYQPLDGKKHRDIAAICNPLKKLTNKTTADYTPSEEVKVSSEEDWRKRVEDLKARAKSNPDPKISEMIREIENRYLKNSSATKQEVTESKNDVTSFEAYLSRVNLKVPDSKTEIEKPTKETRKVKKQPPKLATQKNAKSQPSKPPVKKEICSQAMEERLASLDLEERLDLILEYIMQGQLWAIDKLLNFEFEALKDYQSLSEEERIAQNLPAKSLVKYLNSKKIDGKTLPEPLIEALVAYTKQISSWRQLMENKERQDVFMAILYYRSNEWDLPLAGTVNVLKAFAADKDTFNFMKSYRQVRRNDFHSALMRGEIEVVAKLQRLDLINTEDGKFREGETPLQAAAFNGQVALIEPLLAAGANISYVNAKYGTAVHMAVLGHKPDVIAKLIAKGAQVDQCIKGGETPLNLALRKDSKEAALALIEHGADVNLVNFKGETPLHYALLTGQTEVAVALIKKGAKVNLDDSKNETPLHFALQNGKIDIALALIEHGVDVNQINSNGKTPLNCALQMSQIDVALALIKKDAKVNSKSETPLHFALRKGKVNAALALIKNDANVNAVNGQGDTPLHIAASRGYTDVINALLENNADLNQPNAHDRRELPLHNAVKNNRVAVIKILLGKKEAKLNEADSFNQTPLYIAVEWGYKEAAKMLIADERTNIHKVSTENGESPLYVAVCQSDEEMVATLLEKKADVNQTTETGQTPLIAVAVTGKVKIASALLAVEGCRFEPYKATIEEINEMVEKYGDTEAQERAKSFIEKREADEEGEFSILPHEIADIFGHEDVKKLIYNKMMKQEIKNTHQLAFFNGELEISGEKTIEKITEMSNR